MSISRRRGPSRCSGAGRAQVRHGFTLVEMMVAGGLSVVVGLAIALLAYYSGNSFVVMGDYVNLAQQGQLALDKMAKDIRQARALTGYATNSITLLDVNGNALFYAFDPTARTLTRCGGGVTNQYLTGCDMLNFWIYQHTVISNTFDCYAPAYVTNTRLVEVTWSCSTAIPSLNDAIIDTGQSAQIALRNH